ncbi:conserved hypothetical protein [Leishmania major strain Friedlin]|uniref:Uncharacterized protein n=1 Tax=Leishmania major TaxID=5664 RepID=Q4Q458_LEIMA|nr:conserved hypothetical protein [Leishmania major strain Friedlin]CAG9580707.1 hypothetical_protein_-_conserved [Leishmania major strain Friedlin]CAJ06320.1 conserved hypothetical protein [Leishmania major strain Friedlin]|eukprot:XP_001685890.1 conserved hypothetical protein [Leishmania major strain Friedlin]
MSGIIHKESLPGQSVIKRRRIDTQATTEPRKESEHGDGNEKHVGDVLKGVAGENDAISSTVAQSGPCSSAAKSSVKAALARSSSSSGSSSDDEDDGDQIERENARLAKLREQRSRRQQEQRSAGVASSASSAQLSANTPGGVDTTSSPSASKAQEGAVHTNSYDHDVLFRNRAWCHPSKSATAAEKQQKKWDSVLNRTQDSVAFGHFMKNFFK